MQEKWKNFSLDAEFLYQSLSSGSNDYTFIWDIAGDTALISENMAEGFGLPGTYLEHFMDIWMTRIHERDIGRVRIAFREILEGKKDRLYLEYQVYTAAGKYMWINIRGTVKSDASGSPALMAGVAHNLEYDGKIDNVTGLFSYEKCREFFEVIPAGRLDYRGTILLLGIDEFTNINTMNNHSFGDLVLRNTVMDIQKIIMERMAMYRFDGDQFFIVGDGLDRQQMKAVYTRIQEYTDKKHEINGQGYRFTVSAGLICYPEDGLTWTDMEKGASIALKNAKERGKNQCAEFTREMLEEKLHEQSISRFLADGISNSFKGFHLVFQPVCEAETLKIKGAEALLRFDTPDGRVISPLEFIPLLENSRLIIPVGLWVLEQAMIACKAWVKVLPDFVMNVNVSYIQLRDSQFCEKVENLLELYEMDIKNITLELTESYFITDAPNINKSLTRLQELHLQLAMDDFGTGYSSLARLAQFNVDVVKIDKIFVQSLHKSKYNHDFVDSVVRLCHNVGMKVCVEGVETREEQRSVCLLNADYIQGFYVSKPVSKKVFYETFIRNPEVNNDLVVAPDGDFQHQQLVGDRELLAAMIDATPLCINIWSRNYELMACNEEIMHLFGIESFAEYRENFFKYSPEYQPDGALSEKKAKVAIREAYENGRMKLFWVHLTEKGKVIPSEVILVRIRYQSDYIVASYTRDIREQIAIEEKGRKFSGMLKSILDASPLSLSVWNEKLNVVMCNRESAELFSLSNEEEYTKYFYDLSPEKQPDGSSSRDAAEFYVRQAFETGRAQFRWMHCKKDGEMIPSEITLVRIEGLGDNNEAMVAGYTRDIRAQFQAEKLQQISARRIRAVIDATPLTCLLSNTEGVLIDCNQNAVEMFGAENKEDLLRHFDEFLPLYQPDGSRSVERRRERIEEAMEKGSCICEWMYIDRKKEEIPCEITVVCVREAEEDMIVAYGRDLRELRHSMELNARLTQMAYYDLLTGTASRANFMGVLSDTIDRLKDGDCFGVLIFDLDYFKNINDTYGHEAGDEALKYVAARISSMLPEGALLGRYGGDEFTIQIKDMQRDALGEFMNRMVCEVSRIVLRHEDSEFKVTISIGATYWKMGDADGEELLKRADQALYEAKRKGRNRGVIFHEDSFIML